MLRADDLYKAFGSLQAVSGVSFTVGAGQIVGLLGPNGAGKSTTVAMLCGLLPPDRATVTIDGAALGADDSAIKARLGVVPQELALYDDLSALANLELFSALYGLRGAVLRERSAAALELVGLVDRARDKPARFSGGMRRRLNIACALVHDPQVLLLDEPTVGVDPQSRNAIFDNLETLRDRGKALLYTTHYMEEAERLCDRIVIIDRGRVIADDDAPGLRARLPAAHADREHTLTGALDEELRAMLASKGVAVRDGDGASLEAVFLHLTGRRLRDDEPAERPTRSNR